MFDFEALDRRGYFIPGQTELEHRRELSRGDEDRGLEIREENGLRRVANRQLCSRADYVVVCFVEYAVGNAFLAEVWNALLWDLGRAAIYEKVSLQFGQRFTSRVRIRPAGNSKMSSYVSERRAFLLADQRVCARGIDGKTL